MESTSEEPDARAGKPAAASVPKPTRDSGPAPDGAARRTPLTAQADRKALKAIEGRHEALQALPAGSLGQPASRVAAALDAVALDSFTDKGIQARAATVLGDTADQQPAYRAALKEVSPPYAALAERQFADDQLRSANKDARKALEFGSRRDDAADNIAARYEALAGAGLTASDLKGPALDRLASKDSRDLLLIDGSPPHPRAGDSKALVSDSLKVDAYRATFERETAEWVTPGADGRPELSWRNPAAESRGQESQPSSSPSIEKQNGGPPAEKTGENTNAMRSEGDAASKRRAIPPLEDRFNIQRTGLIEQAYHFRDQAGKVAFTDKLQSITTSTESPAAIKAMVDRAAERGWQTVRLSGSPEFARQGWIAATAQGLKPVGHTPTIADQEAATKERVRLQVSQDLPAQSKPSTSHEKVRSLQVGSVGADRDQSEAVGQRLLAAAIEKALADGKVSPELRGQVRVALTAEGAKRASRGERFKVPVYDARAPRTHEKTLQVGPQRLGDRERSR